MEPFGIRLMVETDVVMEYAYARCDHRIEAKDFDPSFHDASIVGSTMGHTTKQLTWILPLMQTLPDWVTIMLNSDMASYVKLQGVSDVLSFPNEDQVSKFRRTFSNRSTASSKRHTTAI